MHNATRIPIDVDALKKGQTIPVAEVEKLTGKTFGTTEYLIALMGLSQFIERAMNAKGLVVTVCTEKGSVKILSDEEASAYNMREFGRAMKKATRTHWRQLGVNTAEFTEQAKVDHERSILVQSRMLQAANNARDTALLTMATHRSTPSMLPQSKTEQKPS